MSSLVEYGPPLLAALIISVAAFIQVRKWQGASVVASGAATTHRVDDKEEEEEEDKIVVKCFFGSQTGTAESFAKDAGKALSKAGFKAEIVDLEDVTKDEFCDGEDAVPDTNAEYHLYFMATYGEGDPTDNAIDFMSFLKRSAEDGGPSDNKAEHVRYSTFALGNTQYEHYNNIGKTVHKRLSELGAKELHPLGLGDDDKDIEEDFNGWMEGLVETFARDAFGSSGGAGGDVNPADDGGDETVAEIDFQYRATFVPAPADAGIASLEGRREQAALRSSEAIADLSSRHLFQGVRCTVHENRELCQKPPSKGGLGSTVHVEIGLEGTELSYNTADNLTVCAANDREQVEATARYLGLQLDQWIGLERTDGKPAALIPSPCTIRSALTYFTDLNGMPTRSLLKKLAPFASIPAHRTRLRMLASKEGAEEFQKYILNKQLSIAELFETFPSFAVDESSLGGFLEVMPRLKGREFTIASSSLVQPDRIALTVGVVRDEKPGEPAGRLLKGVASTHLQDSAVGSQLVVFVKESTFKMPQDASVPIILVGPGTGIAPMRAFVQERTHQRQALGADKVGDSVLFFGCRREEEDFLYKDELMAAVSSGALTALHTAFSRQQAGKVYVQHILEREARSVWSLLEAGAYVYVCGATRMGKDVNTALTGICAEQGGLGPEKATEFIQGLQKDGRYIQELWSS